MSCNSTCAPSLRIRFVVNGLFDSYDIELL